MWARYLVPAVLAGVLALGIWDYRRIIAARAAERAQHAAESADLRRQAAAAVRALDGLRRDISRRDAATAAAQAAAEAAGRRAATLRDELARLEAGRPEVRAALDCAVPAAVYSLLCQDAGGAGCAAGADPGYGTGGTDGAMPGAAAGGADAARRDIDADRDAGSVGGL